jgi:predicted DNA repair protein MutK
MPGTSLLALLDDITSVLDDVAVLTKVASAKTAGVLGDDLALNAEQVAGVSAERELPVVWAVARGSLVNKAILIPIALALSALTPWAIAPLLMVGGGYLCFEGAEKVIHALKHRHRAAHDDHADQIRMLRALGERAFEAAKVKGAIRTDFVLSAEIVTIALGLVSSAPFLTRVLVLVAIGLLMTVGVYGLVAVIVKLDDLGRYLCRDVRRRSLRRALGTSLLHAAPRLMKALSVLGTVAMFLVGGGIVAHGVHFLNHSVFLVASHFAALGSLGISIVTAGFNACLGAALGLTVWGIVESTRRLRTR